ncbi:MAG: hypothetical protein IK017_09775 [Paludibacteraceae bacterium]|nr:hypothetical protein [Paludibacteraceae bacterium]
MQKITQNPKDIDAAAHPIEGEETLARLLCSPLYFNEKSKKTNPDAFDLRILPSGSLEEYVSLARIQKFVSDEEFNEYLATTGYKIWDDKQNDNNKYYGYGLFNCKEAREVHEMIEINPLTGKNKSHVGLFYKHSSGGYYCGPLPKTDPTILEVLSDMADLLDVRKAPDRLTTK